jgi:hypothetical protein
METNKQLADALNIRNNRVSGCLKTIEMPLEDGGPIYTVLRVSLETSDDMDINIYADIQDIFDAAFDKM